MSYISEQLLTINLNIHPSNIKTDIDNVIKQKLKEKMEGKCSENGYVIEGSTAIIKRSIGSISTFNNCSMIKYTITYKAKIISPTEGTIMDIYVNNVNKMGVIGYIKLGKKDIENIDDSPAIIIIPKEYFNDDISIENFNKNDKINIIVVGCRIKYNSDKIQIVGKPL